VRRRGLPVLLLLDYESATCWTRLRSRRRSALALAWRRPWRSNPCWPEPRATSTLDRSGAACEHAEAAPAACRVEPALTRDQYERRFDEVQQFIRDGHTYQINLTFPLHFRWFGEPLALYRQLRARQKCPMPR